MPTKTYSMDELHRLDFPGRPLSAESLPTQLIDVP
jgi:hypothetical protein